MIIQKLKKYIVIVIAITLLMYALVYRSFYAAEQLTNDLVKNGHQKQGDGSLSYARDGLLYFFTRKNRKKLATYNKIYKDGVRVSTSLLLASTHSTSHGSSNFIPKIQLRVKIMGRKDKFHYIKDLQCPSGDSRVRNKKYEKINSVFSTPTLENGIVIDACFTDEVVNLLDSLKFEGKANFLSTTVWYPQKGTVDTKLNINDYDRFEKDLENLLIVYRAMTL